MKLMNCASSPWQVGAHWLWAATLALSAAGFPATLTGQSTSGAISGVVVSTAGTPIEGATVSIAGTNIGALTNRAGRFLLFSVPDGEHRLEVRLLGFRTAARIVQVEQGTASIERFTLIDEPFELDGIIVSGTGSATEKRRVANTVGLIDAAVLANAPITSFSELVQGREPSLMALTSDGAVGSGTRIRIRGSNSITMSNEPLIYIDGLRVDNSGDLGGSGRHGDAGSPLDDINWSSVDRVEVLKGPAAATLYGSEASSGVIQIFTRAGRPGPARGTIRADGGWATYPSVFAPAAGFTTTDAGAAALSAHYGTTIEPFEVIERDFVSDLLEVGYHQAYSADVSGGTDVIQYFVAGRVSDEDGPLGGGSFGPASDRLRRIQTNASLKFLPKESLQLSVSMSYVDSDLQTFARNNEVSSPLVAAWLSKPERASCAPSSLLPGETFGEVTPLCSGAGNPTGAVGFGTVRELYQHEARKAGRHLTGALALAWNGPGGWSTSATVGMDQVDERLDRMTPFGWRLDGVSSSPVSDQGSRSLVTRTHRELTFDGSVGWQGVRGPFEVDVTAGGQAFLTDEWGASLEAWDFPAPGVTDVGLAAQSQISDYTTGRASVGTYLQTRLGYDDWLFGTAGARLDRTSAFGSEAGAAFYPRAGISAVASEMGEWEPEWLTLLRVRAAYGRAGLQPGSFDRLTTFAPRQTPGGAGFEPENIGNVDLRPEQASEWEVGMEAGLWNGVLAIDVTYWNRVTRDALVLRPFPAAGGFTEPQLANIGQLDAHGIEATLSSSFSPGRDVSVRLFANGAFLRDRVTSLGGTPTVQASAGYPRHRNSIAEGYSPGAFLGARLLPTCAPGIDRACWEPGVTVPYDIDGDGSPDTSEAFRAFLGASDAISLGALRPLRDDEDGDLDFFDHRLGKPMPDWQGSFGGDVTLWSRLTFATLFEYRTGDVGVANLTGAFRRAFFGNAPETAAVGSILANPQTRLDPDTRYAAAMRWAREQVSLNDYSGMNQIEDADMLRWREANVTWRLPSDWSSSIGAEGVSLTFSARNLLVWTPYSGTDPEANEVSRCGGAGEAANPLQCNFVMGTEAYTLPLPRRFSLSARVVF